MSTKIAVRKLQLYSRNKPTMMYTYTWKFTREKVRRLAQKFSNEKYDKDFYGKVYINLYYKEENQWRSGKGTDVGESVSLYSSDDYDGDIVEEPEYFTKFKIYLVYTGEPNGGDDDENNDCFYNCLVELIPNYREKLRDPESFKRMFQLKRKDKVPISLMSRIEDYLALIYPKKNYKITVTGDHTYHSERVSNQNLILELVDGHYSVSNLHSIQPLRMNCETEKILMIYSFDDEKGMVKMYGVDKKRGEEPRNLKLEIKKFKALEKTDAYLMIRKENNKTLKEAYESYIEEADKVLEITKGRINLYKAPIVETCLKLFFDLNKTVETESILEDETKWIEGASHGAIMWGEKYEGETHSYDFVSMYPSVLYDCQIMFAVKRGEFMTLTRKEFANLKYYKYGIYRAEITNKNEKLFRTGKKTYYTHYDLGRAKELGFDIELIQDDKPNFLYYERSKLLNGSKLFKEYIDILYELKSKGIATGKKLLNTLWGALGRKNEISLIYFDDTKETIRNNSVITSITCLRTEDKQKAGKYKVKFYKSGQRYATNYARIVPFLLARGRVKISKTIEPHLDLIKRVQTDGFLSTKKIEGIKTGTKMGELKYEGYCKNTQIKGMNDVLYDGIKKSNKPALLID